MFNCFHKRKKNESELLQTFNVGNNRKLGLNCKTGSKIDQFLIFKL